MTNMLWDSERRRLRPQFIRRAAAYVDGTKIWEKGGFARDEIALRTLVRVADESCDIEEVLHFVRAKIGQTEPGRRWRYRDFGESLIRELTEGLAPVRKEIEERLNRSAGDVEVALLVSRWFVAAALEHFRYRREVERAQAEKVLGREAPKNRVGADKRDRRDGRDAKKRVFGDGTAVKRRQEGEERKEKCNHTDTETQRSEGEETEAGAGAGAEAVADAGAGAEAGAGAGAGSGAGADADSTAEAK